MCGWLIIAACGKYTDHLGQTIIIASASSNFHEDVYSALIHKTSLSDSKIST
jgi:hypothetical protein